MNNKRIPLKFYAPQYWGTWLALGLLRSFSLLPYGGLVKLSNVLSKLIFPLAKRRRHIIKTNIDLCFPEKTVAERKRLVRDAFTSTIMAIFEISFSWWANKEQIKDLHTVDGIEHLNKAIAKNKGVILLVSHFTTMEIAGSFLYSHINNLQIVYKRSNYPLLEYFIQKKRVEKGCSALIKHKSLREIVRSVKNGNVVWFAPDQDIGTKDSVFAPFMGVMASTLTSTQRLAKITGAPVVPFYVERSNKSKGYIMHISPELQNFPTDDDVQDATTINHAIEKQVRQTPEQYLWAHRRFKSRPIGEADVYTK